ncbi:MAG: restriction endonuclease subunit S [Chloroflexi bacterium]|nr:restriction endonuclease subunit S [Chloroflexota bacterium]
MTLFKQMDLGDIVTFQRGFDITKAEQLPGTIPIISSSGITSFHNESKVIAPGVIIGRKGTLGAVYYTNNNYWPHDTTLWVKDFKGNFPKFIYYFLKTLHLENFDTGSSNPTLNRNHIHKIRVYFPESIEIQRKIAAILSAYDELIEVNRQRIALLEQAAEELYREWFVRMRFPGYEHTPIEHGIPQGWEVVKLNSVVSEIRKGIKKKNIESDNTKYIGLEHIPRKSILISNSGNLESFESDKLLFESRDILFGKIRPYLHKISLAHFSGICSTDTIILRVKHTFLEGFVFYTLFSDDFVELANVSSKGTKMPRADWDFLKNLEIRLPDKDILVKYQEVFESNFAYITALDTINKELQTARDQLLPKLMAGTLDVSDLDVHYPPSMR